ncbi:MAG: hypothetical protein M1834_003379 [Cirrosporium novae-zelandiae]|nr:MAG: hypothetical protein M1834_003379 [Cirrosporium novae-zelandiae]
MEESIYDSDEQDVLQLPPLPSPSPPLSRASSFSQTTCNSRKRPRWVYCDSTGNCSSSDPPLFSSDDSEPSAEDYINLPEKKRKKRTYRGGWWGNVEQEDIEAGESHQTMEKWEREFHRNLDSGVWIGSEASSVEITDGSSYIGREDATNVNWLFNPNYPQLVTAHSGHDPFEEKANQIIQACLEEGKENIDISDLGLKSLTSDMIEPLKCLTRHPPAHFFPPSQEFYAPLTPSLHIFLSHNILRSLPGSLFDFDNLTVLSLQNNKLTEIPPAIHKLSNLVELNVSGNKLKWLPWEILLLLIGKNRNLKILSIYPNPFCEARDFPGSVQSMTSISTKSTPAAQLEPIAPTGGNAPLGVDSQEGPLSWEPTFLSFTPPSFLDNQSRPLTNYTITIAKTPSVSRSKLNSTPPPPQNSHVPSLLEHCLRTCSSSPFLPHLSSLLPQDASTAVFRSLKEAVRIKEEGGRKCSDRMGGMVELCAATVSDEGFGIS